ncbi:MAG: anthranilate phosphoribosyltransferase [Candidatus Dormibacteraceae bacterium]
MRLYLDKVVRGENLTELEAESAMAVIMAGGATPSQIAAFLIGLKMKGESLEEVIGLARAARVAMLTLPTRVDLLDVVGTGGDGLGTFNISTVAAIVIAAGGVMVAKHGNRAASSRCGSADVLGELGVEVDLNAIGVGSCLEEVGIAFLYAPRFHPAFSYAAPVRRELGVPTVFNLLGPLCNPARPTYQVTGVTSPRLVDLVAEALARLGLERVVVYCGVGGMDELSSVGPAQVTEILDGQRKSYLLDPAELGLAPASVDELAGGDRRRNAEITRQLLHGARGAGRDAVLLTAAAGFRAAGMVTDWPEGISLAAATIDSGRAEILLERWINSCPSDRI